MSRAHRRGRELRRKLGLRGRVDVDAVANILGLEVVSWPFEKLEEMMIGDVIGVSARLDTRWRRWVVSARHWSWASASWESLVEAVAHGVGALLRAGG